MATGNVFYSIVCILLGCLVSPIYAQPGMAEIREHFYNNVHLVTYPMVEYVNRSNEPVQEYIYEFEVFPGGSVSDVTFDYQECQQVELMANGGLHIYGPLGETFEAAPYAYQELENGEIKEIGIRYSRNGNQIYLDVDKYEWLQILTIEMRSIRGASSDATYPSPLEAKESNPRQFTGLIDD